MTSTTATLPRKLSFFPHISRANLLGLLLVVGALYYSSLHSFLLFHSLVELFSVLVSFAIFVIAWNARHIIKSHYLLFLGIAYLFVGMIDLEHTLAYKGMGVLGNWGGANHATQLWVAARYTESLALFIAPFFLQRRIRPRLVFSLFLLWSCLLLWSIYTGFFPVCFSDKGGLTLFKKISEYVISFILAASYLVLYRRRHFLDGNVYRLLVASIFFTIASELTFTHYISVFGPSNIFGHLFKFISAYFIYQALIETGLKAPYSLLFLELKKNEEFLAGREEELEKEVSLRTAELARTVQQLRTLTLQLSEAENRERRRLAEILHDDLQQLLAAANMHLNRLAGTMDDRQRSRLAVIDDILKKAIEGSRSLSHELSPGVLYRGNLNAIFEWLAGSMEKIHRLNVSVIMPDNLWIESDTLRVFLFRAVQELLFNVVKHADTPEATITVERREDNVLQVTIADRGKGFDPGKLVDSDGQMSDASFGLFSIHERLRLLGGSLDIDSQPGEGSRFIIHLPLQDADPVAAPSRRDDQTDSPAVPDHEGTSAIIAAEHDEPPIRILLADDHEAIRQGFDAVFKEEKDLKVVAQARDGEEAVRLAGRLHPDVVVMDLTMPRMDGIEATELISRQWPEMAIIIHSMHTDRELMDAALAAGAKAYHTKADNTAELLAAIRSLGRPSENSVS